MSSNKWIILAGVFIGIAAIRFIAKWFITMIEKYPTLEPAAYMVIGLLGLKLIFSGLSRPAGWTAISSVMELHWFDLGFSCVMLAIFIVAAIFSRGHDDIDNHFNGNTIPI